MRAIIYIHEFLIGRPLPNSPNRQIKNHAKLASWGGGGGGGERKRDEGGIEGETEGGGREEDRRRERETYNNKMYHSLFV